MTDLCAVENLRPSPLNPAGRVAASAIKGLKESIRQRGIIVPLVVTKDGEVVDGHRRLQCAKELSITTVPVVRVERDPALWSDLTVSTRPMRPREYLEYHLAGGLVTSPSVRNKIVALEKIGGRAILVRMLKENLSHAIYSVACAVSAYVDGDKNNTEWMALLLNWLIDGHRQDMAGRAMKGGIPPAHLYQAIVEGRDIKQEWGVARG